MIQQSVKGRQISPLAGILVVVGLAVSIVLVSWIERAIAMTTGFQYGSFAVWILIVIEAVFIMRLSVMACRYTVAEDRFFIERVYGDHARIVYDIPLSSILAVGEKDEVFKKYGNAQAYNSVVIKKYEYPEKALAYAAKDGEAAKLLLFQPNDEIFAALSAAASDTNGGGEQ